MSGKPLFNLGDSEYQFWKPFNYKGRDWTFDHLAARKHTFVHPERNEHYTLYFTISHHVFTLSLNGIGNGQDKRVYPHKPSDKRAFCESRYNLSLHLPEILETLPDQFCYHGGYGRYCTCKLNDDEGNTIYYQVVYRVWKKNKKLRFHVESAYPLPQRPGKVKKVSFWVICYKLLKGKKLPTPGK